MAKLTKSPKFNFLLGQMGIFTNYDVIYHIPKRYDDFSLTRERELEDKEQMEYLRNYKNGGKKSGK